MKKKHSRNTYNRFAELLTAFLSSTIFIDFSISSMYSFAAYIENINRIFDQSPPHIRSSVHILVA